MTDKYKTTFIVTVCLIAAWGIGDGILVLTGQPTISQMAYHRAREDTWIFWATGGFFVWLFVHLFWRWKNIWSWIREKL